MSHRVRSYDEELEAFDRQQRGDGYHRGSNSSRRRQQRDDNDARRSNEEDDVYMGDKLAAPPDFDGPTKNRKCTDVLCSLLILIMWIALSCLGFYSISNGNVEILLNPMDFDGNICGLDYNGVDMRNYSYLYTINYWHTGICLSECPSLEVYMNSTTNNTTTSTTTATTITSDVRTLITYGGIHQLEGAILEPNFLHIPAYYLNTSNPDTLRCELDNGNDICFPNQDVTQSWSSEGINKGKGFAYYVGESRPILNYCTITETARTSIEDQVKDNATLTFVDEGIAVWKNIYADIYTARLYVFGVGFGLGILISLIYVVILRLPFLLNSVVWGSILASITLFAVGGVYGLQTAEVWENEDPQHWSNTQIKLTRIFSYVLMGVAGIAFLMMICLRKEIQLAIGCVKETGKAVSRMPMILFVPVLQGLAFVVFTVVFVIYGLHLASLGEVRVNSFTIPFDDDIEVPYRTYHFDEFTTYAAWGMLFCFFWTANFIIAAGDMIVALAIAKWYFTRDKGRMTPPVASSIGNVLYYHLGTVAFGSLVLATVQFVRAILARVQQQAKKVGGKFGTRVATVLFCCCQCCLWCFEKCIRFINKNAYIQTAIFGKPFCASARDAFYLILRNMGRIGAVSFVSGFVLVIGKLFISVSTTTVAYYLMVEYIADDLHSLAAPTILVFLIAYFLADMFLDVFEIGLSAILQCFVADEEMFDGADCYAEGNLQNWIDKYQKD